MDEWKDTCNAGTMITNPNDYERWIDFVVSASEDANKATQQELIDLLGRDGRFF